MNNITTYLVVLDSRKPQLIIPYLKGTMALHQSGPLQPLSPITAAAMAIVMPVPLSVLHR